MGCPCGGYPSIRNNELKNITTKLLTEVCHGVTSEPTLQPLTGEQLSYRSANVKDDAHLDVVAGGFSDHGKLTLMLMFPTPWFLLIVLLHFLNVIDRQSLRKHECTYEECIREIEYGSFTPLNFSCSGGMGLLVTIVYKLLASLIPKKSGQIYSMTLYWLRCRLSFSQQLLDTCLRGSRSSYHCFKFTESVINLVCAESHLELDDN